MLLASRGMDGGYGQYEYLDEKTEALAAWGEHVAMVTGNNVVPLKRA